MNDVYTLVSVEGSRAASHRKHFVVTKVSTLLIITRVSSGLKKSQMLIFSEYKYQGFGIEMSELVGMILEFGTLRSECVLNASEDVSTRNGLE